MLARAELAAERALRLPELEVEVNVEGLFVCASVALLQGRTEQAEKFAAQAYQEANKYELVWLATALTQLLAKLREASRPR